MYVSLNEFQIKHHQYVQPALSIMTTQAQCLGKAVLEIIQPDEWSRRE